MNLSYKGKILISTPETSGDIFSRSVVLIIEHDEDGAFGLILNKKNEDISQNISQILETKIEIYDGGPVAKDKVFFVLKGSLQEYYHKIDKDFYLTEDMDSIIPNLLDGTLSSQDVKVFSGYSGWGAGQLDEEVQKKYWVVAEHHQINYVAPYDQQLWKKLMQSLGGRFLLWANAPDNISLN